MANLSEELPPDTTWNREFPVLTENTDLRISCARGQPIPLIQEQDLQVGPRPGQTPYTNKTAMGVVKTFVANVVPAVIKPMRVLWNEIIGFFFLVFGVIFGFSVVRRFRSFDGDPSELFGLVSSALFVAMLLGYGLYSFLRARKIHRS